MATDSNEVSTQNKEASSVKVSSGGDAKHGFRLSKIKITGKTLLYLLVVILVIACGWLLIKKELHVGQKVYAQAAGHKIYEEDVENLIGNNKNISQHDAAEVLADKYLIKALVKGKDITVSDADLTAQYGSGVVKHKNSNKYAYQNSQNQLYFQKIQYYNYGIYKGKYIIANFSRNVPFDPALPEDQMHNPNLGNPAAIAKDKKYAQDFITNLDNQIKSGKITFDQAIQKERDDSKIGVKAYPSLPHSGPFDTSSGPNYAALKPASIRQKVNDIKAGTITAPFVVRVGNSLDGTSTADSYFLVIDMEKSSHSYTSTYITQYLDQAKQRLGYKVYV